MLPIAAAAVASEPGFLQGHLWLWARPERASVDTNCGVAPTKREGSVYPHKTFPANRFGFSADLSVFFFRSLPVGIKTMMMIETTSFGQQLGISKKNLCPWTCRHHHTRKPPGPLLGHQRGAAWQPPGRHPPGPVVVRMSAGLWRNFWEILRDPSSLASAAAAIRVVVRQRKERRQQRARSLRVARTHVRCECTLSHSSYSNRNDNVSTGE